MNGWTLTRVWQVDHELVVAKTIEEAIELFKTHMGNDLMDEPKNVRAIGTDNYIADYDALIKEETNTPEVKDVDLEKEIGKYLDVNNIEYEFQVKLFDYARHFYELGLKVHKIE